MVIIGHDPVIKGDHRVDTFSKVREERVDIAVKDNQEFKFGIEPRGRRYFGRFTDMYDLDPRAPKNRFFNGSESANNVKRMLAENIIVSIFGLDYGNI